MGKPWAIALVIMLVAVGLGVLVYARRVVTPHAVVPVAAPPVQAPAAPEPTPGRKSLSYYLGVVIAEQVVDIAPNLDGRLADVLVRVGDRVAQGAAIAYLDLHTLENDLDVARAAIKAAKAEVTKAKLELADSNTKLERSSKLGALIPATEIEAARSEKKLAATRLDSASAGLSEAQARVAKLEITRTDASVRAPFTGVVAARYLDKGALVQAQTPIIRLMSSEQLRIRFAVPEDDARGLVPGTKVKATLPALGIDLHGKVETVAPEVDAAARMIFAEARLDPPSPTARPPAGLVAHVTRE